MRWTVVEECLHQVGAEDIWYWVFEATINLYEEDRAWAWKINDLFFAATLQG